MHPERWQSCTEIFNLAVELPANERAAFLERSCGGDEALRCKVELLLKYHDTSGDFIKSPAFEAAPELLAGDPEALIGQHLGCYRVDAVAGVGGMGVVYLAWDERLGRKVALKLLPQSMVANEAKLGRLKREARTASALNHPNIVTIHEIGEVDSTHYVATEFIEGITLRERMTKGPIPPDDALDIAAQVASALCVAHRAGIVHRDIKPENIMLRPDGYVKVLDFGIAKLAEQELPVTMPKDEALLLVETNVGLVLGTVRYMSPEQAVGTTVDKRTDIWSLGVVLYEMVTGHEPFMGDTPKEVMTSILEKEPPPLTSDIRHAPAELQQVISKTLRKNREERYQSAHELLEALKNLRRKLEFKGELKRSTTAPLWLRWTRSPIALVLVLLVVALALAVPFYRPWNPPTSTAPEKSIAVLPLENLSDDKENVYFADGIQDEVLSHLSKIKDLKVTSRTSAMQYKSGTTRNLKEIGQQLGVTHVLEGDVRRAGQQVRVSVQLIDTRTDAQLWAEHYDRDVADVFAMQTEVAQQIADQLQAKLTPEEKAGITDRPTADLVAYALYTEARAIDDAGDYWEGIDKPLNREVELLERATQRDPTFALGYCALARARGDLYLTSWNRQDLEYARKAADEAVRLRPDLGETHRELARSYFCASFSAAGRAPAGIATDNFNRAREELAIARRKLPNDSETLLIAARIDRHQNRWNTALAALAKAYDLDPRNGEIVYWLGVTYFETRQYHAREQLIRRCIATGAYEDGPWTQSMEAEIKLAKGEPGAAQSLLEQIPLDFSPNESVWETRLSTSLYLRDYDAANRVIAATPAKWAPQVFEGHPPESWADGEVALARGDKQHALVVFAAARKKLDATWGEKARDETYFEHASKLDSGLGRKDDAIGEARRAVELMPMTRDAIVGPGMMTNLAVVYAWTGELERALAQLEIVAKIPEGPTYGDLRFNPCWDCLRGDERFDKVVAAAKSASR